MHSETVKIIKCNSISYDIIGYFNADTRDDDYEFYDIFESETGECINEGNPFYCIPNCSDIVLILNQQCHTCSRKMRTYMADLDGTNLEERYGCEYCQ